MIHPTAIVDPKAELYKDVTVGPYTIIGPHVTIGAGTTMTVPQGGRLFACMNDEAGWFGDNAGHVTMTVSHAP